MFFFKNMYAEHNLWKQIGLYHLYKNICTPVGEISIISLCIIVDLKRC